MEKILTAEELTLEIDKALFNASLDLIEIKRMIEKRDQAICDKQKELCNEMQEKYILNAPNAI